MNNLPMIVALLLAVTSLAGLLFPAAIYQTEELRHAFLANDVVNLLIGLPVLLGSMVSARKGILRGLLFLPGALFFVTYNAIAYTFALTSTWRFLPYLILALLSGLTIYLLLSRLDIPAIGQKLSGKVAEGLCGGALAGFGVLFFLRGLAQLVQGTVSGAEWAVVLADLFTTPFWIIGGNPALAQTTPRLRQRRGAALPSQHVVRGAAGVFHPPAHRERRPLPAGGLRSDSGHGAGGLRPVWDVRARGKSDPNKVINLSMNAP
jgi:hypothetical protein